MGEARPAPALPTLDSTVVPATALLSSEMDGQAVILDLTSGASFALNHVGARIWELLQEVHNLRWVRDTLLGEFEVEPGRCEADLLEMVRQLLADGLVRVKR